MKSINALAYSTHTLLFFLSFNQRLEMDLQLSSDGKRVLFRNYTRRSNQPDFDDTQHRLYSLDLEYRQIEQLRKDFMGNIIGYTMKSKKQ
jgi:hypothetical protein